MIGERARTLYDVLNVSAEAEPMVIEAAYRALMKKYHPDQARSAGASVRSAEINAAYAVLRDAARRADYDREEWAHRQAAHAALIDALAAARRSRRIGAGGWSVAALLCALMVFIVANREFAPLSPGAPIQIALSEPAEASPPPAVAGASLGSDLFSTILPPAHAAPPQAELAPVKIEAGEASSAKAARPDRSVRDRPAAERRGRSTAARDAEFLEREDFIY